jgi:hypothetical protein
MSHRAARGALVPWLARRPSAVLLAAAALVAATAAPGASSSRLPDPAQALHPGTGVCGTLQEIALPSGLVACTHGPDPAPLWVDPKTPQPLAVPAGLILPDPPTGQPFVTAAAGGGVRCYGDGSGGNRVHAVYARPSNRPDRFAQVVGSIRQWAAETDAVFNDTAARYGAIRHIRFLTDSKCNLIVDNVVLSPAGDDTFDNTLSELAARGYNRSDRKYLVWMDSTVLCGIAAYYPQDRPDPGNANNGPPGVPGLVARVDSGCWGLGSRGESIEAHEIMHSLGAVLPSAPNSTPAGHCDDESDRMCYSDGSVVSLRSVCGGNSEALFDCGGDDYFHPSPPAGSYLATRWNTARSSFLASADGEATISIGDIRIPERNSGTRDANFTVSLGAPMSSGVSVRYTTANGTAASGSDFLGRSGIISFQPGETAKTIPVPVAGDAQDEVDETFFVNLFDAVGAPLVDSQALGLIADDDPQRLGYRLVATDGGIFAFGEAPFYGSTGNIKLNKPINAMAATPSAAGYWMVASDGGIFAFGDAQFFGSTGGTRLDHPVVGMATTPTGRGYWLATAGGQVFPFGEAGPHGSMASPPSQPIVGIASTPGGGGYWLAGRDGRVYPLGDARDLGSAGNLSQPVVAIAATPSGGGYWLLSSDGGLFGFGDAGFYGSMGGRPLNQPIVGIAPTPTGEGYWMVASDGGIFSFGDATFLGSTGHIKLNRPIVGMTNVR